MRNLFVKQGKILKTYTWAIVTMGINCFRTGGISLLLLSLALFGCSQPSDLGADSANSRFDHFKHEFLEEFWQLNPEYALYSGRYEFAPQLSVDDSQQFAREKRFVERHAALLKTFKTAQLNQTNKGDWAIIDNQLQSMDWYRNIFRKYEWDPSQYNIAGPIGLILNTDYTNVEQRLQAIGERLLKVPAYYRAAMANIHQPALPQTRIAIEQNQAALRLLQGRLVSEINSAKLTAETQELLLHRVDTALAATRDYVNFLEKKLPALEQGDARDFRIGAKLYERKFALDIASQYSARQIYDLAVEEKQRLHGEMIRLAQQLWPTYFPGSSYPRLPLQGVAKLIEKVAQTHATPEGFVLAVQQQIPELEAFVQAHDLMDTDREKPLVVRETPDYQRGFSIASVESPGPYDSAANTYYNVEPVTAMAADLQDSHLREYNIYTMQILNIHEAIPGHYTQLVHANKSPSLIKAIFGNGAMVEGWAVYTERMMLEQGYGDNSPELWLMYYKWNLRTVVNTILDYSIQVLDMSEQQALALLMNEAFQESAEARGKWRRASLSQVQLTSYYTGYKEIYAFREAQKEKLGKEFNLKTFHNQFLSYGSAPVSVITANMLAEQK